MLTNDEVQAYLRPLDLERKLSGARAVKAAKRLPLPLHVGRSAIAHRLSRPLPKAAAETAEILSREEVWRCLPRPRIHAIGCCSPPSTPRPARSEADRPQGVRHLSDRMTMRISRQGARIATCSCRAPPPRSPRVLEDAAAGVWLFAIARVRVRSTFTVARRSTRWPSLRAASRAGRHPRLAPSLRHHLSKPASTCTPCSAPGPSPDLHHDALLPSEAKGARRHALRLGSAQALTASSRPCLGVGARRGAARATRPRWRSPTSSVPRSGVSATRTAVPRAAPRLRPSRRAAPPRRRHRETCDACGAERLAYNSCRNRALPEVPDARERALARPPPCRAAPREYFHIVFTLPHALNALLPRQSARVYRLLFAPSAATLTTFGRDPRHLGG